MSLKITILGCGNSSGVPSIGNYWGVCDPNEPKNRRSRCCLAVQSKTKTIIIDTGADFRHQMNKFDIRNLDYIFYSHHHGDHCHGIDELRSIFFRNNKQTIKCYGGVESLKEITGRFEYIFKGGNHEFFYPTILDAYAFEKSEYGVSQMAGDIGFIPFEMDHGTCTSVGYRFGNLTYCVDMKSMDAKALEAAKGSKIWIVDGAAYNNADNAVHADFETLYRYNEIIGAERVYITALSSSMDYQTMCQELPKGFYPAYDGLSFDVDG